MPRIDAFPYLTFGNDLVQPEPWQVGEKGQEQPMPVLLKDWDPLTDLFFSRTITFDFPEIFKTCGLSDPAEISVTASWYSPGTGLKEPASSSAFAHNSGRREVSFAFRVKGTKLAGSINLVTRVLLRKRGRNDSQVAATYRGSILWEDEQLMSIEGFGARFPMEFADFAEHGYPPGAGWRLYWRKDFDAQVMGSMWLLINREHERLRTIVSGAVQDPEAPAILQAIHFAVARDLIVGGITDEEFTRDSEEFPKGSVGEAIRLLIRRLFNSAEPEAVRQLYETDADRFHCQLQHALRLFHPRS